MKLIFINEQGIGIKDFQTFCDIRRNLAPESRSENGRIPLAEVYRVPYNGMKGRLSGGTAQDWEDRFGKHVFQGIKLLRNIAANTEINLKNPILLIDEEARLFLDNDGATYVNEWATRLFGFGRTIYGGVVVIDEDDFDNKLPYGSEYIGQEGAEA